MNPAIEVRVCNGGITFNLLVKGVLMPEIQFCDIRPGEPGYFLLIQRVHPRGYPNGYLYQVANGTIPGRGVPIGRTAHE